MIKKIRRRLAFLLIKVLQAVRILFYRAASTNQLQSGRILRVQPVHFLGRGNIVVEGSIKIGYFPSPFFINTCAHIEARMPESSIIIGDGTHLNNKFVAIAEYTTITVGKNCKFGTSVEILDSDFHGISIRDRGRSLPKCAKPVSIGDDVFVGSNVRILKGVTIGSGSVIANSSVVTTDIPSNVIAGGNPARVIKEIE